MSEDEATKETDNSQKQEFDIRQKLKLPIMKKIDNLTKASLMTSDKPKHVSSKSIIFISDNFISYFSRVDKPF